MFMEKNDLEARGIRLHVGLSDDFLTVESSRERASTGGGGGFPRRPASAFGSIYVAA